MLATTKIWQRQGLTKDFLSKFWQGLQSTQQVCPMKSFFMAGCSHPHSYRQLAVSNKGQPSDYMGCGFHKETQWHCCCNYSLVQQLWQWVPHFSPLTRMELTYTCKSMALGTLLRPTMGYKSYIDSFDIETEQGRLTRIQFSNYNVDMETKEMEPCW